MLVATSILAEPVGNRPRPLNTRSGSNSVPARAGASLGLLHFVHQSDSAADRVGRAADSGWPGSPPTGTERARPAVHLPLHHRLGTGRRGVWQPVVHPRLGRGSELGGGDAHGMHWRFRVDLADGPRDSSACVQERGPLHRMQVKGHGHRVATGSLPRCRTPVVRSDRVPLVGPDRSGRPVIGMRV